PITHPPADTPAQRLRAPANTFTAVALTEPPTGRPLKSPDAMFAAPCAMKSFDGRLCSPPGFGTVWLTPAAWTSATTATDTAPVMTSKAALRGGREGRGTLR